MANDTERLQAATIAAHELTIKRADAALAGVASYIENTQPVVDRYNQFLNSFNKHAHQTAGALAGRGIIAKHEVGPLVDKLAENPLRALDLVEKVAKLVHPDTLGGTADDVKVASANTANYDAFERLALFGDVDVRTHPRSGMVE